LNDDPRTLVRRYYDALNRHDLNALDDVVSVDLVHHGLPGARDRDALKEMLARYLAGFPDLVHTIEDVVVEGDRIAVRTTTAGTHTGSFLGHVPSGRGFRAATLSLYRTDEKLIREVWEVFDTISMLQQIGLYVPARDASPEARAARTPGSNPRASGQGRRPPGPNVEISLPQIRADPLRFLARLTSEYGDYVRYVCEGRETVLLNDREAVRHVLHHNEANYSKHDTPDLLLLKPMLGDGLLTTVGPVWKQDREWFQPALARRRMEGSVGLMAQVVHEMLARWRARPNPQTSVDIVREMSRLTLEIAARVLFSSDFASQSYAFGEAMDVLNETMGHAHPENPDIQIRFRSALALIRRTVLQTILSRRFYDTGEDDLLASLLQSQREREETDRHVIDQAVTMLLAGHETTAKALSWTIALLDQHPDVLARLLSEVRDHLGHGPLTVKDLSNLTYTQAVIDEALRLFPPIWLLTRTTLEDDEIAGYDIPAGSLVAISPYLIHRHPALWEQPDRFDPDRFLAEESAAQAYRYIPFGHGPRHCVGKFFALLEMPVVLATLYSQFSLASLPGHILEAEALVTLRPRNGLPMIVTPRNLVSNVAQSRDPPRRDLAQ
jgi:cytochrome P450/predicted ester cyclase